MAVARRPLGEDFAVKITEGRKKRDGAVTAIVVRAGADVTLAEWQTGWPWSFVLSRYFKRITRRQAAGFEWRSSWISCKDFSPNW